MIVYNQMEELSCQPKSPSWLEKAELLKWIVVDRPKERRLSEFEQKWEKEELREGNSLTQRQNRPQQLSKPDMQEVSWSLLRTTLFIISIIVINQLVCAHT